MSQHPKQTYAPDASVIQTASGGGESVTVDRAAVKEAQRDQLNHNLTNVQNRVVRPYFYKPKWRSRYG